MGRFITEDPIKDGNNWYAYCMNNPLGYIDPTGLKNEKNDGKEVGDYGRWINSSGTKNEKNKGKKTYNNPGNSPRGNPYGNGNRPNYHGGNYTNNGNKGHTSSSATSSNPGGHYRRGGGNGNSHKVATPTSCDNFDPNYGLNSGSPFNLDFGVDYSGAATKAWDRGHYWNAGVLSLSSTCELAYDALVAYYGAQLVSSLVTTIPYLYQSGRDSISRMINNIKVRNFKNPFRKIFNFKRISPKKLIGNPADEFMTIGPGDTPLSYHRRIIQQTGTILEPVLVKQLSDGGYMIINGHHRWLAAVQMGLKKIPIKIIEWQ